MLVLRVRVKPVVVHFNDAALCFCAEDDNGSISEFVNTGDSPCAGAGEQAFQLSIGGGSINVREFLCRDKAIRGFHGVSFPPKSGQGEKDTQKAQHPERKRRTKARLHAAGIDSDEVVAALCILRPDAHSG